MSADPIPVLCVLARYHKGDHDETGARAVRESRQCGAVVRMIEDKSLPTEGDAEEDALAFSDAASAERGGEGTHEGPGVDVGRYNEEKGATEMVTDDTRDHGNGRRWEEPLRADPAEAATERLGSAGEPVASAVAGEESPPHDCGALPGEQCRTLAAGHNHGCHDLCFVDTCPMSPDPFPASPSPADSHSHDPNAWCSASCPINHPELYRAKPPRKVKGQAEDPAALWTLEKVEVVE